MATAKAKKAKAPEPNELRLRWTLAELPSSQHRAGLAGLVMMIRWLGRQPRVNPGICEITELDERHLEVRIDKRGVEELFDVTYAASREEVEYTSPLKKRDKSVLPPLRTEQREELDKRGKPKTKTIYVYPQVVPKGAFLAELDPTATGDHGLWIKLWRDMIWQIMRGVPAQRAPFDARAENAATTDGADTWAALVHGGDGSIELPSTYYLGAQAFTAELVPFQDRVRFQFLLHFWPFAAQVYVPRVVDNDNKSSFVGYAICVPDIANLVDFVDMFPVVARARDTAVAGYRPKQAVVDLPAESALKWLWRIGQQLDAREGNLPTSDLLLGIDVIHAEKQNNSIRILATTRVLPEPAMVDEYAHRAGLYEDPGFRRIRLQNLLDGAPWHRGLDRYISTSPSARTFQAWSFRKDARLALTEGERE